MNKHTPGPWFIDIESEKEWDVCVERGTDWLVIHQATPAIDNFEDKLTDEDKANARLIAAAPDLLEALKQFLAWGEGKDCEYPFQQARAAIAKATGGAA